MQESGDRLAVTISSEMDVLYDPRNLNSESRTRVALQNEANMLDIEYDLPSPPRIYGCSDSLVSLLFTD